MGDAAFVEYTAYATGHRRAPAEPTDDLMSVLVHAEVDGDRLTDDELVSTSRCSSSSAATRPPAT